MIWVVVAVVICGAILFFIGDKPGADESGQTDAGSGAKAPHAIALPDAVRAATAAPIVAPLPKAVRPDLPPGMYTFGFIWRWEDDAWHLDTPPECEPITRLFGVDGALWATSWKELWQHTADGWVRHDMPVRLFALHGWSADAFMIGGVRNLYRLDGESIVPETTLPESVSALWGPTPADVYAVGWSGMIMHLRDGTWAPEDSGEAARLTGVWGQAGEVVVVGEDGVVLVSSGDGEWTREVLPGDSERAFDFAGLWGDGAGTWYAITRGGYVLARRDGGWTVEHAVKQQLLGVQGCAERGEIWVSGLQGGLWRSIGDGVWVEQPSARANSLNTVHRDGDRVWVGGDWFFEIAPQSPGVEPG